MKGRKKERKKEARKEGTKKKKRRKGERKGGRKTELQGRKEGRKKKRIVTPLPATYTDLHTLTMHFCRGVVRLPHVVFRSDLHGFNWSELL